MKATLKDVLVVLPKQEFNNLDDFKGHETEGRALHILDHSFYD